MTDVNSRMAGGDDRGLCSACAWWQAEHDGPEAELAEVGLCMQPELTHFSLQVAGRCGCNRYAAAEQTAGLEPAGAAPAEGYPRPWAAR